MGQGGKGRKFTAQTKSFSGWQIISDILNKYPKHESVAVAIKRLKEQAEQEHQAKLKEERRHKKHGRHKGGQVTLDDFKTSDMADKAQHLKSIEFNINQL